MWKMLQQKTPDDFVISTNKTYTVKIFVEKVFKKIGIKITWKGKGVHEKGVDAHTGKRIIEIDPFYFRPKEVNILKGDNQKAKKILKWKPETDLDGLISIMVQSELKNKSK